MATYREYAAPATAQEAYALIQKKSSVALGGNMWLRQCGMKRQTAVDLSALGLDKIEESEDGFLLGASVTLRQMETHRGLEEAFGGVFAHALSPIVGVQFRNTATLGGSVYGRFGFSDVCALLLALDAEVILEGRGAVMLSDYMQEPYRRDLITHVRISKGQTAGIASVRLNANDFPVLVAAASVKEGKARVVLGARPGRAVIVADGVNKDDIQYEEIARETVIGGNRRAGEAYRRKIAPVLMKRAVAQCAKEGE